MKNIIESQSSIFYKPLIKRLMSESATLLQTKDIEPGALYEILKKAEQGLGEIANQSIGFWDKKIGDILGDALSFVDYNRQLKGGIFGIPSGFSDLDRALSGFQRGDLTIIAARPGMGKTNFGLSIARNASCDFKKAVAIFSLDNFAIDLAYRFLSMETGFDPSKLLRGEIPEEEMELLPEKISMLMHSKIHINDEPRIQFYEFRSKCQKLKSEFNIEMVVIDCLQLMDTHREDEKNKGQVDLSNITRSLKALAVELDIPIIAISDLGRQPEKRGGIKKPILLDLREYGPIERDADRVLFLYRPEYYKIMEDEEGISTEGLAEILIAKNIHGAAQTVKLRYKGRNWGFEDWEDHPLPPPAGGSTDVAL